MPLKENSDINRQLIPRVGILVLCLSILVVFATLGLILVLMLDAPISIPIPRLFWWNTLLIVCSSMVFQWGWTGRHLGRLKAGLQMSFGLGTIFLVLQVMAWYEFYLQLAALDKLGMAASYVYLLSGLHGIHLLGALGCILFILIRFPYQPRFIENTLYVWHFLGALWLGLIALMAYAF